METITRAEIVKLLGISRYNLQQKNRTIKGAMPPPVGKDRNYLLYDRKAVLAWIEHYQDENRKPEPVSSGLDNRLARQFLSGREFLPRPVILTGENHE